MREKIVIFIALFLFFGASAPLVAFAGQLTYISDTIGSSAPAATSSHMVQFTATDAIPAGGKIVITPSPGDFTIPASLSELDVDFLITSTSSDYVDRDLAASASTSTDGVSITSGTSGNITLNLNTLTGIAAGDRVRVLIGGNALYQATGTEEITNPTATTTYKIDVATFDPSNTLIDTGETYIAIVGQVAEGVDTTNTIPPYRYNGAPSGEVPYNTTNVEISLNTDKFATCKYSTTAGVPYDSMTDTFPTTGVITHAGLVVTGLEQNVTYKYYVKCVDLQGNKNPDDYLISFHLGPPPDSGGTGGGVGGGGGTSIGVSTGGGGGGGGGGAPFPATDASVHFTGISSPFSTVTILQDGSTAQQFKVGSDGAFDAVVKNIPHGTYTFGIYATDPNKVKSATYNTTFSLVGGTGNTVTNVYLPPTITLDTDQVNPGGLITVSGYGIASSTIDIETNEQKATVNPSDITHITATSDQFGQYSGVINTTGFARSTYEAKAKSILTNADESDFSTTMYYGVGVSPKPVTHLSADLNQDGSVNLIDFSILLFHWGTNGGAAQPPPDINQDGTVSLTDFSIMLFQWTG